jgi:hypothetical protein
MEKKKFVIYWDKSYGTPTKSKVVKISFFSEEKGFDERDILAISNINIGEAIGIDDNHVWIMRVK